MAMAMSMPSLLRPFVESQRIPSLLLPENFSFFVIGRKNFCATHLLAEKMGAFVIEPHSLEWLARMASLLLQLQWVLQD
jgi:hypothetical protein